MNTDELKLLAEAAQAMETRSVAMRAPYFDAFNAAAFPAVVLELIQQLEAANRDAERYRWLRNESLGQWMHPIVVSQHRQEQGMKYVGPLIREQLDAAIDAAMKP